MKEKDRERLGKIKREEVRQMVRERESETDTERVWKTDAELQVTDMMSLLLLSLNCY